MTDASQEGTLAEAIEAACWGQFLKMPSSNPGNLARHATIAADEWLRSKGVPVDALEHGRMEAHEVCVPPALVVTGSVGGPVHQCNGVHRTEFRIVPDPAPETAE